MTNINNVLIEMTNYYQGDPKRIQHFLKVHSFAKFIAEQENLPSDKLYILDNRKTYQELENNIIKKLCNLYDNKALSNKDRKKIWLLKVNPSLYCKYRNLSKLWKNIFNR